MCLSPTGLVPIIFVLWWWNVVGYPDVHKLASVHFEVNELDTGQGAQRDIRKYGPAHRVVVVPQDFKERLVRFCLKHDEIELQQPGGVAALTIAQEKAKRVKMSLGHVVVSLHFQVGFPETATRPVGDQG